MVPKLDVSRSSLFEREANRSALVPTYRVIVTPTTVLLQPPTFEPSNRILRKYSANAHCFIRVSFTDEDLDRCLPDSLIDNMRFAEQRFGRIMKHGIHIAGRRFSLLAWSTSGLKVSLLMTEEIYIC